MSSEARCALILLLAAANSALSGQPATDGPQRDLENRVGPATESRFPPLRVGPGFQVTLFACDPLVEYPSVISLGPKPGTIFVAHDYVTGLGVDIVRRDEIRLLQDRDEDGYADQSTLYAGGFNSIQGLAYYDGSVYAMHAPLLTVLRDRDGDGVADQRRDLISGLGLPPEENANRLHCANGVVAGHDGWLYLALGDRGCDVQRPEGDRLLFQQGGILRCRFDGSDLHVFAGGLRNIYDLALDDDLNVFVRDNENDGGDYMIRVCHSFHGADHGYPYLYYEHPDEALPPLADLGRGSSAGGVCYLETTFPRAFQGNLFFCEWGRAVVRYQRNRAGSGFGPTEEREFASGAADDPYGFKPTDIVVDRDGSLLVSDWADGQRPRRGRGRIYRITYAGPPEGRSDPAEHPGPSQTRLPEVTFTKDTALAKLIVQLDSPSYHVRVAAQQAIERRTLDGAVRLEQLLRDGRLGAGARRHAVWILARAGEESKTEDLLALAEQDADPRVRAQAIRAVADATDPILVQHRLAAGRGSQRVASRLARLDTGQDPRLMLEVMIALGRLRWPKAPQWVRQQVRSTDDAALNHAAMQTLRRADNWPAVVAMLDERENEVGDMHARRLALRAVAGIADQTVVDALATRLRTEADPRRRLEYADLLSRVYKKPGPWVYWGFRPAARPANTIKWQRSERIAQSLERLLTDPDGGVRKSVLKRMLSQKVPVGISSLARWLSQENDPRGIAAILEALSQQPAVAARPLLEEIVQTTAATDSNRLAAFTMLARGLDASTQSRLLPIATALKDGPVLAAVLRELGKRPDVDGDRLLLDKLNSKRADVRAAAIASLGQRDCSAASAPTVALLHDPDVQVRRAAAAAAGQLKVEAAVDRLVELTSSPDSQLQTASLLALKSLQAPGALPRAVAALSSRSTELAALAYLEDQGDVDHIDAVCRVAKTSHSVVTLAAVVRVLSTWQDKQKPGSAAWDACERAVADVHGSSGLPLSWRIAPAMPLRDASPRIREIRRDWQSGAQLLGGDQWRRHVASGTDAHLSLPHADQELTDPAWLAVSNVHVAEDTPAQFLASSSGSMHVWLNDEQVFQRQDTGPYRPDADRFQVTIPSGTNRLLVQVAGVRRGARFHLRFRRTSSKAEHERLTQLALKGGGNLQRGREVFLNADKSLCQKCHRIGDRGGDIGPNLSGLGSRFSRIHVIESILDPSRTVAPSYATVVVALTSGQVLSGVQLAEDDATLSLGDKQGVTHQLSKRQIELIQLQAGSTMPDGLEQRLTNQEFVDLLAFLLANTDQQTTPAP